MSIHTAVRFLSRLVCQSVVVAAMVGLAPANPVMAQPQDARAAHDHNVNASLVQLVRDATRPFLDINQAIAAGYGPFLGCISGPEVGAMGFHYVNGTLAGDGELDAAHPEALMYEISGDRARLLGVEFIVDAATWLAQHNNQPPVLEGQSFQYVGSPNRYASPAFFELHVWAWQDNPNGRFVDWNPRVNCDRP